MTRALHNHRFEHMDEAISFLVDNYQLKQDEACSFIYEECFQVGTDKGIWINTYRFVTNS